MRLAAGIASLLVASAALAAPAVKPVPRFTDTAYQKIAADKVLKAWKSAPGAPVGKKTVLIALIGKDGTLQGLRENMTTGFKPWDDAATKAVKDAQPFPPLPASWQYPTLEVHFHFEAAAK